MAQQFIIQKDTLEDIAFAVRKQENSTEKIKVSEIANRIENLEGNGGEEVVALTREEILAICK